MVVCATNQEVGHQRLELDEAEAVGRTGGQDDRCAVGSGHGRGVAGGRVDDEELRRLDAVGEAEAADGVVQPRELPDEGRTGLQAPPEDPQGATTRDPGEGHGEEYARRDGYRQAQTD